MSKIRLLLRKAFSSVTIMVIPHGGLKVLNVKVPVVVLFAAILLSALGGGYLLLLAVSGLEYKSQHRAMAEKVKFYSEQFSQWDSTITGLKRAESKFRNLFSVGSKEEVLKYTDASIGSLEVPNLAIDLKTTIENVAEIRDYLKMQKDIYSATPAGFPVPGRITSPFGKRDDPLTGDNAFHSGIDLSCSTGVPVQATADGVVSLSGWLHESGFMVVLEHGCGFETVYAHNETNSVKVGQTVKRGDVIGYVGSTGRSTGPHLHYEVWRDGKTIDPRSYLQRRS